MSEPTPASDPTSTTCAECGARMPVGAPWCSLCFAVPGAGDDAPDDTMDAATPVALATAAERDADPDAHRLQATDADVDSVAAVMLAQLAAQRPAPSRLGALAPSLSSPVARAAAGAVGVVVVSALAFGLMALLGTLL